MARAHPSWAGRCCLSQSLAGVGSVGCSKEECKLPLAQLRHAAPGLWMWGLGDFRILRA